MKVLKKVLLIFLGLIVVIIAALAIIPIFFKDEINAKIKSEIANTIDAKVDYKDFSLSLFSNFPNFTLGLEKLTMIGTKDGFKNDTLFSAENFNVAVDLMSVISGDQMKVKGIFLDKPYILTKFLKDGRMSWDITKPSADTTAAAPADTAASNFSLGIEKWQITDGIIIYDDASLPMYTELRHVEHEGKGEMAGDIFKILESKTTTPEWYLSYDNVTYLNKHSLDADVKFNMDLKNSVYTFIDNLYKINDFKLKFGGEIAMPTDDIKMDLKFGTPEDMDFKNLISLIPAFYTKDFENIKTEGKLGFEGWYKGIFNDTQMPGFGVNLVVKDAMMKYPNLDPVKNINIDVHVVDEDGSMTKTVVDLRNFSLDIGNNPVRAKALIKGFGPADIDASIKASLNLAYINKVYPIEGTTLAGVFNLDATAKGTYNDAARQMPLVNAKMSLVNGNVKSKDVPFPLEGINMSAVAVSDGSMPNSSVLVESFKMMLQGEPFEMKAFVKNFDDINYDVSIKGIVDLTKLTQVVPMEGMTLAGRINADISTKGKMSDVEAGRYDKTTTSGTMGVKDFKYSSTDMPQGMTLSSANFSLTPEKMGIENMDGTVGKSDISLKGSFSNYMGYMFGKSGDTTIHGNLALTSKKFDVNEWMTEEETPATATPQADEPMTVFEVPRDVDFTFNSNMNKVLYDSMVMENFTGIITMKDGIVQLNNAFSSMGGAFKLSGAYNTQNMKDPKFDMNMKIDNLELKQAYNSFSMVKKYAPIMKNMEGKLYMELASAGSLGQDMMPVYKTVNGGGKIHLGDAVIKDNKALAGVATLTQMKNLNPMNIKDVNVKFKIVDGNVEVEPFDVKAGDVKMNVSGKQSLEGTLDYLLKMDIPAGAAGLAANNALAKLTGATPSGDKNVKLDFKVTGPVNDPKVRPAGGSVKDQATEGVKGVVTDKVNAEVDDAKAKLEEEKKKAEEEARKKLEEEKKRQEDEAKRKLEEEKKKAEEEAKKKLQDKIKIPKF
ncbi:MAG: AsmA family protein [Cytophagaceae bacterium]|nr:AsmA family protein [Cytophagaceae bacterium]